MGCYTCLVRIVPLYPRENFMKFSTLFKKITASTLIAVNLAYPMVATAGQYVGMVHVKDLVVDSGGTLPVVNIDTSNTTSGSTTIGGAKIKIAPNSAPFGSVAVGTTSAPQTITLSNLGSETAVIGTIPSAGPFKATSNCNGVSLPSLATCRFNLEFSPTEVAMSGVVGTINVPLSTGTASGSVVVTASGTAFIAPNPETLKSIAISGFEGQDPALTVNAQGVRAIDSGVAIINSQSTTKTFTITSNGGLPVAINAPTVANDDGSFQTSTNCPATLPVGQSCTITAKFEPVNVGVKTATLFINSGAYAQNAIPVVLTGEAIDVFPVIGAATTASVDFGNRMVGSSSQTKTVTIYNTGTAALNVGVPSITGTAKTGLSVISNGCTAPVAVGAACAIQVQLTMAAEVALDAALTFTHDGRFTPTSPLSIPLTGKVLTAPHVVAYSELQFGDIPAQTETAYKYAIVENTATDLPVTLTGAAGDTAAYTVVSSSNAAFVKDSVSYQACFITKTILQPGEKCYVAMKMAPAYGLTAASGPISGYLSIATNLPSGSLKVPYTANFLPAELTTDVSSVTFANDTISTTAHIPDMPVVYTNTGAGRLYLNSGNWTTTGNFAIVKSDGSASASIGRTGTNLSTRCEENTYLNAGQSCTVMLRFLPQGAAGIKTGTLQINAQLPATLTRTISLTGKALAGQVTISATTLDLGSVLVGSTTTKSFIIGNNGDTPLSLRNFARSTENFAAPNYSSELTAAHNCPASIAPGEECVVTVTFAPDQNLNWGQLANQETFQFQHFSNGTWATAQVPLAGVGYGSTLIADQHTHSLGYVETTTVPQNYQTVVTFTANGPAPVRINTATPVTGTVLETYAGGTCVAGLTLQPGESCTLNVRNKANFAGVSATGAFSTLDQVMTINGTYYKDGSTAQDNKLVRLLSEGTYAQEISISEINPRAINTQVAAYTSLHNAGIRSSVDVKLDGTVMPHEYVSATEVRLTIPAGLSVGTHTITVENHDGRNVAYSKTFEVQAGLTSVIETDEVRTYAMDRAYLDGNAVVDSLVLNDGRIAYLTSSRVYLADSSNKLLSKTPQFSLGHSAQYLKMSANGNSISVAVAGLNAYAQSPYAYQSDTVTTVQLSLFTVNAATNTLALGNPVVRNLSGSIVVPYGAAYSISNGSIGVSRGSSDTALSYAFTYNWGGTYTGTMLWSAHTTPGTAVAPGARTGSLEQVSVARSGSNVYARFGDKLYGYSVSGTTLTQVSTNQYTSQLAGDTATGLVFDSTNNVLFTSCYTNKALCAVTVNNGAVGAITKIAGNTATAGYTDGTFTDAKFNLVSVNRGLSGTVAVEQSSIPQAVRLLKAVPTSSPVAAFTPNNKSFTSTNTGASDTFEFVLNSTGYVPVQVSSAPIITGSSQFTVESTTCSGTILVGSTCSVVVKFSPTGHTAQSGFLTIPTNAGSISATLSGTGLEAESAVSAASVSFGNVWVNASKPLAVVVSNTGNLPLTGTSLSVSGAEFQVSHACPATIAPGASCNATITYSPVSATTASGSLTVAFNEVASKNISLSGTGIYVSSFSLDKTSASFSNIAVGGQGVANILVSNMGNTALTSPVIATAGAGFSVSNTCGTSVPVGGSCTATVTFSPVAEQAYNGSVSVQFAGTTAQTVVLAGSVYVTDTNGSAVSMLMHMDGTAGSATFIEEKGATFTAVSAPVLSADAKFGTGALRVGANGYIYSTSKPFASVGTGDFTMEFWTKTETPGTLNSNYDQITFDFYPIQIGVPTNGRLNFEKYGFGWNTVVSGSAIDRTGNYTHVAITRKNGQSYMFFNGIQVATTAILNGVDISQTGNTIIGARASSITSTSATWLIDELRFTPGVARYSSNFTAPIAPFANPGASIAPTTTNFTSVAVGSSSSATVTLTAGKDTPLTLNALPTASGPFSVASTTCAVGTMAVNSTCTVSVQFSPVDGLPATGILNINTNEGMIQSTLKGTGIAPIIALSTSAVNFGNVNANATASLSVVVTNNGTGTATTPAIATSSAGYSASHNCGATLAPASSCTVNVTFAPTAAQAYPGTLSIGYSNAATQNVSLSGTGVFVSSFSLSTTSLAFGNVNTSATSNLGVVVTNTGNTTLSTPVISTSGSGFSGSHNCAATLAPAASCTLTVTFAPTLGQAYSGSYSVAFTGVTAQTGTLSGTGLAPSFSLSTTSIAYGSKNTGTSTQNTVVITNNGGVTLNTPAISTASSGYSVSHNCGTSLTVGSTCTVTVTFSPVAATTYNGTASIGFASLTAQTVSLSGTGVVATDYGYNFAGTSNMAVATQLPDSTDFTVEAWIKLAASGSLIGGTVWSDVTTAGGFDTWVDISNTDVMIRGDKGGSTGATTGGGALGGVTYAHGKTLGTTLHHVVWSNNATGSAYNIYIDGVKVAGATGVKMTNVSEHNMHVGSWMNSSRRFNGVISELRVYTKAMTAGEVTASYTAGRTGALGSNIAAAWNFQENTGTTVTDYSGNGRTGILAPGSGAGWVTVP